MYLEYRERAKVFVLVIIPKLISPAIWLLRWLALIMLLNFGAFLTAESEVINVQSLQTYLIYFYS